MNVKYSSLWLGYCKSSYIMMSAFIMNFISKKFVFGLILTFAVLWVFLGFACFFVLVCFEGQEIV